MQIPFAKLNPNAKLPERATPGAAGLDLRAALGYRVSVKLRPFEREAIPTGLQIQLPPGFEAQVRPRSGLALNHGVTVLNSPGTIDADYRGEIRVLLINLGWEDFVIEDGDRIAQLVIGSLIVADPLEAVLVDPDTTKRGSGGFGSTGLKSA